MKLHDNGGPAFPFVAEETDGGHAYKENHYGMSIRDWFAGQALAGLSGWAHVLPDPDKLEAGRRCYALADAMLEARES